MRVLLVGAGGREHALAWKLAQSPEAEKIYLLPGNGGTPLLPRCENLPLPAGGSASAQIVDIARRREVDLVVVGPEEPLVNGLADILRAAEIAVFGPGADGAALEGSKAVAKEFMENHGIPTAAWRYATTPSEAIAAVDELGPEVVVKADGLAAGKGVVVAETRSEAEAAVQRFMVEKTLGSAGSRLVVEERLKGQELSLFALTDGIDYQLLATAMDHKPIGEGNRGPNTGGMGVVAPHPLQSEELLDQLRSEVVAPSIAGIRKERLSYRGVLFIGLMLTDQGPKVLEYNVRFGDPETQAILPLFRGDLLPVLLDTAKGRLGKRELDWRPESAVTVVASSGGYPGSYKTGYPIRGINRELEPVKTDRPQPFIAGATARPDGELETSGGRVLSVTGIGASISEARENAYQRLESIHFEGIYYRKDIGSSG